MLFSCYKIKFLFLKTPKTAAFSYVLIENIQKMARKAQEHARVTHNLEKNVTDLYSIYKDITLREK